MNFMLDDSEFAFALASWLNGISSPLFVGAVFNIGASSCDFSINEHRLAIDLMSVMAKKR